MKIGVMVESFRQGFRGGVEKAAAVGAAGIQAYATYGELAPENMTEEKIRKHWISYIPTDLCFPHFAVTSVMDS